MRLLNVVECRILCVVLIEVRLPVLNGLRQITTTTTTTKLLLVMQSISVCSHLNGKTDILPNEENGLHFCWYWPLANPQRAVATAAQMTHILNNVDHFIRMEKKSDQSNVGQ